MKIFTIIVGLIIFPSFFIIKISYSKSQLCLKIELPHYLCEEATKAVHYNVW